MIKTRTIGLGLALLAVMAVLTVVVWTGQGQQNQAQASGPNLTATLNDDWSVDLAIQDHQTQSWYYTIGANGACTISNEDDATARAYQSGEQTITAYVYTNYLCTYGYLDSTTITVPTPTLNATRDGWKVDLELTDGPNPWYFRFGAGGCVQVSGTEVNGISGYTPNTYTIRAYSDSTCDYQIASDSVTIPNASLSATANGPKVDLDLSDGPNPWYFRFANGGCTQVSGTEVNGISGYQPNTYNIVAYSDSACASQIATDSVTTSNASLTATRDGWKVDLDLSDGPNPWYFRLSGGTCTQVSGTERNGISGYTSNTYNVVAYSDSGCANQIATDSVTIPTASLDATRDGWDIDLELTDGPNPWYFRLSGGTCTQVSGTELNGISGYTSNTYNVVAYSDSGCGKQIATDSVTIPTASLDATRDGWDIDLELTDGPNPWYFRLSGDTCTQVSGTERNGISGYTSNTYNVVAYSDSGCGKQIATDSVTIPTASLAVTVGDNWQYTSTLTNGPSQWWLTVDDVGCVPITGSSYNAQSGESGTNSAKAYSDSACSKQIASTTFTIADASLSATVASDQSVDLALSNGIRPWRYKDASNSCTSVSGNTANDLTGYAVGTHTGHGLCGRLLRTRDRHGDVHRCPHPHPGCVLRQRRPVPAGQSEA